MYIIDPSTKKGRNLTIIAIIIFLGFSIYDLITYMLYVSNVGYDKLISQLIRLALSIFITLYFYKGRKWAREVLAVVFILDSISYLMRIIEAFISAVPIDWFVIYLVFAFIIDCIFGIVLFVSRDIKKFMEFKKNKK